MSFFLDLKIAHFVGIKLRIHDINRQKTLERLPDRNVIYQIQDVNFKNIENMEQEKVTSFRIFTFRVSIPVIAILADI